MLFPLENPIFKRIFQQNEKNVKAILLPRSIHPTRDSYLPVARPEGCWALELGVVLPGAMRQYIKVCYCISQQPNPCGRQNLTRDTTAKANHVQNLICPAVIVILTLKNQLFLQHMQSLKANISAIRDVEL